MLGEPIYIEGDGKWLTDLLGGEWKTIEMPLIRLSDIKPIILEDTEIGRFTFAVPKL